jgi:hypothetical protein
VDFLVPFRGPVKPIASDKLAHAAKLSHCVEASREVHIRPHFLDYASRRAVATSSNVFQLNTKLYPRLLPGFFSVAYS